MKLSLYDGKHVRIITNDGLTVEGLAEAYPAEYVLHEFGTEEDSLEINNHMIFETEIMSIEPLEVHGTVELATRNLLLRRYRPEDAEVLYQKFGLDKDMYHYSGWNPYATLDMARDTVEQFLGSYDDPHCYGWAIEYEDILVGTIGAYGYENDCIEVGFSIFRDWWGHGFAGEALEEVLKYLRQNEGIGCITAWCAADNIASMKTLEKAGMKRIRKEKDGLTVCEKTYDKLIYEY